MQIYGGGSLVRTALNIVSKWDYTVELVHPVDINEQGRFLLLVPHHGNSIGFRSGIVDFERRIILDRSSELSICD